MMQLPVPLFTRHSRARSSRSGSRLVADRASNYYERRNKPDALYRELLTTDNFSKCFAAVGASSRGETVGEQCGC